MQLNKTFVHWLFYTCIYLDRCALCAVPAPADCRNFPGPVGPITTTKTTFPHLYFAFMHWPSREQTAKAAASASQRHWPSDQLREGVIVLMGCACAPWQQTNPPRLNVQKTHVKKMTEQFFSIIFNKSKLLPLRNTRHQIACGKAWSFWWHVPEHLDKINHLHLVRWMFKKHTCKEWRNNSFRFYLTNQIWHHAELLSRISCNLLNWLERQKVG